MKIFVSYSRRDSGDFADQIQKYFSTFRYDVFTDISSINVGDVWSSVIDDNISKCDIFVVLITYGSLLSPHVEKEVLQAQNENKKIIPCIQKEINYADIKWGLNNIQGIEFDDKYDLARKLYSRILKISQQGKDITSNAALTSPVSDKLKEELNEMEISQPTNKLENEHAQYFSSPVQSSSTSYPESEKTSTYSNSSSLGEESNTNNTSHVKGIDNLSPNNDDKKESGQNNSLKLLAPIGAGVAVVAILIIVFTSGILAPPTPPSEQPQQTADTNLTTSTSTSSSNTPPVANNQSVITAINKPVDITLTSNDVDLNDNLTGGIVTPSSHGTLSPINQDTGILTYTPNTGFTGTDSFTFVANDGKQNSTKVGVVGITVTDSLPAESNIANTYNSGNTPPVANNQSVTTAINKPVNITLTSNDVDLNDNLTGAIVTQSSHGTLSPINQDTGILTYTPNTGFTGTDSFTFVANDGKQNSTKVGVVGINVNN